MHTPFGEIVILIDDIITPYSAMERTKTTTTKDVLGCYQIDVDFIPNGKKHEIKCIIPNMQFNDRGPESGENIECQAFYNDRGEKLSICVQCEIGYLPDGRKWSYKYDYDACYLENGMSCKVLENTVETKYQFGIAWIDGVINEFGEYDHGRDVQTWLAADFTYKPRE